MNGTSMKVLYGNVLPAVCMGLWLCWKKVVELTVYEGRSNLLVLCMSGKCQIYVDSNNEMIVTIYCIIIQSIE